MLNKIVGIIWIPEFSELGMVITIPSDLICYHQVALFSTLAEIPVKELHLAVRYKVLGHS